MSIKREFEDGWWKLPVDMTSSKEAASEGHIHSAHSVGGPKALSDSIVNSLRHVSGNDI